MAWKTSPIFPVFLSISLAINILICVVTCKSHNSFENSNLRTQTIKRYSKESALIFPAFLQQRARCSEEEEACADAKDCCQNGPQLACGLFGGTSKICNNCKTSNQACTAESTDCCFGLKCGSESTCVTDPDASCSLNEGACRPIEYNRCCNKADGYNCITDTEGHSFCSNQCSQKYGACNNPDTKDNCCDGFYCQKTSGNSVCYCVNVGNRCTFDPNVEKCCKNSKCNPDTKKCEACISSGASCTGPTVKCCSSDEKCDSNDQICCIPENSSCNDQNSNCCPGTTCEDNKCKKPCQTNALSCTTTSECCADLVCQDVELFCIDPIICAANFGLLECPQV